jgi:hypothetical protein
MKRTVKFTTDTPAGTFTPQEMVFYREGADAWQTWEIGTRFRYVVSPSPVSEKVGGYGVTLYPVKDSSESIAIGVFPTLRECAGWIRKDATERSRIVLPHGNVCLAKIERSGDRSTSTIGVFTDQSVAETWVKNHGDKMYSGRPLSYYRVHYIWEVVNNPE